MGSLSICPTVYSATTVPFIIIIISFVLGNMAYKTNLFLYMHIHPQTHLRYYCKMT